MIQPKLAIIGTGNLATHLARNVEKAGFRVSEIYGRNKSKAHVIANQLYDSEAVNDLDFSNSKATLFFLCVSDSAIEEVTNEIVLPENGILIHCSGATSIKAISKKDTEYGIFYPIQTFSQKRKISFEGLNICIEASNVATEDILEALAKKMGATPCFMSSEQRMVLHLSAVFACNFPNHFFRIAQELLQKEGLPFGLLQQLTHETINKSFELGPDKSQTGPAVREDYFTMSEHETLLSKQPEWKDLYLQISEDIIRMKI